MAITFLKDKDLELIPKVWRKKVLNKINLLIGSSNSNNPAGVKTYRVLLSQAGGDAPTVDSTIENTLGAIVWTRTIDGSYTGTLAGAFPDSTKIVFRQPPNYAGTLSAVLPYFGIGWIDADSVFVTSFDLLAAGVADDDLLSSTAIEILVYP